MAALPSLFLVWLSKMGFLMRIAIAAVSTSGTSSPLYYVWYHSLMAQVLMPLRPTEKWKTLSFFLASMLMVETLSMTLPRGMPQPQSRTETWLFSMHTMIRFILPMMNSPNEYSITSLVRIIQLPSSGLDLLPKRSMYMPMYRRYRKIEVVTLSWASLVLAWGGLVKPSPQRASIDYRHSKGASEAMRGLSVVRVVPVPACFGRSASVPEQ